MPVFPYFNSLQLLSFSSFLMTSHISKGLGSWARFYHDASPVTHLRVFVKHELEEGVILKLPCRKCGVHGDSQGGLGEKISPARDMCRLLIP